MDRPFTAYKGDDPYIFVSYSHKDSSAVFSELTWFQNQGFNTWYDEGIEAGSEWREEIANAITNSRLVLFFVTPDSVQSDNCRKEVNLADKLHIPILTIYLETTALSGSLELTLSDRQAILKHEIPKAEYQQKVQARISAFLGQPIIQPAVKVRKKNVPVLISLAVAVLLAIGLFFYSQQSDEVTKDTDPIAEVSDQTKVSDTSVASLEPKGASIAVLPFVNMSSDKDQEYFSDGITEDILNGLVRNTRMKVIARTSSFQFKGKNLDIREIGAMLGVTHILEGSVRKAGNQIRVTAQLNSVADGTHVWSDQYDRELTDIFKVQDEITQRILIALSTKWVGTFDSPQPTKNLEAHNAYLLARFHYRRLEVPEAWRSYAQAIRLDPNYVDAIAGFGTLVFLAASAGGPSADERYVQARQLLDRALAINPTHADVGSLRANFSAFVDHDYQRAINEFVSLIQRYPENPDVLDYYGYVLIALSQFEQAIEVFDQGLKASPLHATLHHDRGRALLFAGRYDEARSAFRMAEKLGGERPEWLANIAIFQDDINAVKTQLDRGRQAWPSEQTYTFYEAIVAYMEGDYNQVNAILDHLRDESVDQISKAMLEKDVDLALTYFEQQMTQSSSFSVLLGFSIMLRHQTPIAFMSEFYAHPEYERIIREAGLDDESVSKLEFPPLPF